MSVRYYYLDDGTQEDSKSYATAVSRVVEGLEIRHEYPTDFTSQIKIITDNQSVTDGLILDLRLDKVANEIDNVKVRAQYRAPALAQEIRTRAAESSSLEFPIVLWTLDKWYKVFSSHDNTGLSLFDLTVVKEELNQHALEVGRKLLALGFGYKEIAAIRKDYPKKGDWMHRVLGFKSEGDASFLDTQILEHFDHRQRTHEVAQFLTGQMLDIPGPLIDRQTLAARLGVDLENSGDAQALLDGCFEQARYKGVFNAGWERWWAILVEEAWRALDRNAEPLRALAADKRVSYLRSVTGMRKLKPARPLHPDYGTRYWTMCQKLRRPLDPADGLLLRREKLHRWQEQPYVSFEAYQDRRYSRRQIDPVDHDRLDRMKATRSSKPCSG